MSNVESTNQEANGADEAAEAFAAALADEGEAEAPAKPAAKPAAKKGDEHSSIAVGEKFTLGEEDAALLKESQINIQNLQVTYAEKSYAFRRDEAVLLQAIEKAGADQKTLLGLVGNKHGLKIDKSAAQYGFDIHSMTFTRVK